MAQINCTVERRYLRMEQTVDVTTGSIGSIQCSFSFDAEWDGLTKTAIFRDADGNTYPILIIDDTCTVPNEAIANGCYLTMGVMGTRDGNVVVATEWKNVDLSTGCYTAIAPPSEDIYLQILNEFSTSTAQVKESAQKAEQYAAEVAESLPSIHADAETAKSKAAEATAAAGEAAQSRDDAEKHKAAAQESAADALASAQAAGEAEENVEAMQSDVQELANQVAADKADVAAKAQAVDSQARQVRETAASFPLTVDSAKKAITDEGTKQVGLVSSEGTKQAKAVADKGVEQVAAVNTAGAAQISAATAQGDRAQQEADRAEQEANRAAAIDAYTKSDSRQSFANAFVGEKSGAMVSLSDAAEDTLLRKAAVQGAATEVLANPEAEKSPDNIASISGAEPTKVTVSDGTDTSTDYTIPTLAPLMILPNGVCDEYDAVTGVETRRIGKKTLDGTENWKLLPEQCNDTSSFFYLGGIVMGSGIVECTHLPCRAIVSGSVTYTYDGIYGNAAGGSLYIRLSHSHNITTVDGLKEWLAAQYAAGTPLTVYYELKTPTTTQHDPATIPVVYPATTVYADDGDISIGYNRDSNKVVEQIVLDYTEQITALDARIAQLEIGGQ